MTRFRLTDDQATNALDIEDTETGNVFSIMSIDDNDLQHEELLYLFDLLNYGQDLRDEMD